MSAIVDDRIPHPMMFAMTYCATCFQRWEEKGIPRYRHEELARMVIEDTDPDGWVARAMWTAWGH